MPCVSVILPNYNYARYLKERMCSIFAQSTGDFEVIYVDDASTDESNLVAKGFAGDPRLRVCTYDDNSGTVYRRWNDGAALATGDWLWFAGADDSAHPRFLERLLALAEAHPSSGLLYCRPAIIDGAGRLITTHCNWCCEATSALRGTFFTLGHDAVPHLSKGCSLSNASSMLIKREAFEAAGAFDINLWGAADWDLYLKVLHSHDIAYTAEPLSYYRHHGSNVTSTTRGLTWNVSHAVCITRAYLRMQDDARYSRDTKELVLRRAKSRVFDIFADPNVPIPTGMLPAVEEIIKVVPDKRLLGMLG